MRRTPRTNPALGRFVSRLRRRPSSARMLHRIQHRTAAYTARYGADPNAHLHQLLRQSAQLRREGGA